MKHRQQRPHRTKVKRKISPATFFRQPEADFYHIPELEFRGGKIIAEGCKKILEYTPEKLCLDFGRAVTTFYGGALKIELLAGKRLIIAGKITRIEFTDKRGAGRETI